ncbi:MAG: dihydroorotate dehydrogenase electron transfer subunit [Candidatus Dormibacteria bacterium]
MNVASTVPMLERGVVTLREELMPGVWLLRLHSPEIARSGQAGQFVHIQVAEGTDPLLRRPFSLSDIDVSAETYDIMFNVTGRGTAMLAAAEAGQGFDVLGPLGRPFTFPDHGVLLAVAGGLGVAPFPLVAREARRRDLGFRWLNGAYTAHQLLPVALLPRHAEVVRITDDGSIGGPGLVTDVLSEAMQNVAMVHACGPTPMLLAIARRLSEMESSGRWMPRCEMSMEAPMGCALGTCLGCVVPAADGTFARVCVEGAVFERRELDWAALAALGPLIHHSRAAERLPSNLGVD